MKSVCPGFFRKFSRNNQGNFATIAAIVAPVLLGAAGLATDYAQYASHSENLQEIADTAALAGTSELMIAGTSDSQVKAVVSAYVEANLGNDKLDTAVEVLTEIDRKTNNVTVNLSFVWQPMFAQYLDNRTTPIKTKATARLAGDGLTCVLGLMPPQRQAKASVHMDNDSKMLAEGCSVFSNSDSRYGLRVDSNAQMVAQSICSAGGIYRNGRNASFTPEPLVDCPKVDDPLSGRLPPPIGSCDHQDLVIGTATAPDTGGGSGSLKIAATGYGGAGTKHILKPGTYCGGLTINSNAEVELERGIYIIKDGPLWIAEQGKLVGKEASFYLTGADSEINFEPDTTIDLSAMTTGRLAGLLFFEDRNAPHSFSFDPFDLGNLPTDVRLHKISSNNARNLLGTLYLKNSLLLINSNAPVADQSPYTAIVAGRLWLQEGPTLYLNSDYTTTQVPVPDGLIGKRPILVR